MKLFVIAITLLGVVISTSWAATKDCGCLPGREGEPGPMGNQGRKGDTGQKGENGFRGDQGDTGPRGPKGSTGNKGEPGRNAPIPGVEPTFGPAGEAGPRGRCLCNARRFRDPVIAGDMFLTNEKGEPNFIGDDLKEDDINRMFEHDETTPAPETFKIQAAPNHNGLFMMNANGVLVPVTDANVYDLFAAASAVNNNNNNTPPPQAANDELTPPPQAANDEFVLPEAANEDLTRQTSTTRRTTTTRRPYYNNNYGNSHNNIYVMGPKGSLIPIDALGFKKKLMHLHGHGHGHGHGYGHGGNYHGGNHHGGNYHSNNYHGGNYHGNNYHGGHGHVSYIPHKKFGGYHTSSNGYHTNSNNGGYHTSPNSGGSGGYHTNSNNGGYHYDSRGSSSYNKWLRGILIGEDEPDITNDHADNEDTDDVVTVVKVDATKLRTLQDNDSDNDEELMANIEELMEDVVE